MPEVLVPSPGTNEHSRIVPQHASDGSASPRRVRTRSDRMMREAEKMCLKSGLPVELADPATYLDYVRITGRDPLEDLINRTDGTHSPFKRLLDEVALVISNGETVPKLPKKEREIYEALEDRLRARGWVPLKTRLAIAKILMPYNHHRLATVEVTGKDGEPIRWQEAASKMAMSGPGVRAMMEKMARDTAASMSTHVDSHIIPDDNTAG